MRIIVFLFLFYGVVSYSFSSYEENNMHGNVRNKRFQGFENDCRADEIRPMANFSMDQFKGNWYVTHKMVGGYKDFNNGMWNFYYQAQNIYGFYYAGRIQETECFRPISGRTEQIEPGVIDLIYRTYTFKVREKIYVIYTDYTNVAVIYTCHYTTPTGKCHAAGLHVEILGRKFPIQDVFQEEVLTALNKACVTVTSIIPQKTGEVCSIDRPGSGNPFQILAPDFCYQPPKIGLCKSSVLRFFYNPNSGQCEKFTYSGCDGNYNNFAKHDECKKTCIRVTSDPSCTTMSRCAITCPPCCREDSGGCLKCDCDKIIVDNFHQCMPRTNLCPSYCTSKELFKGCIKCSCEDVKVNDICTKPPDAGNCSQTSVQFFYNPSIEKCDEFIYGGCGGNENRFETDEECVKICQGVLPTQGPKEIDSFLDVLPSEESKEINPFQEICLKPYAVGICHGRTKRYYYDAQKGVCKPFFYSGCGGNKNNFHKEIQCYERCNGTIPIFAKVRGTMPDHADVITCLPRLLILLFSLAVFYISM